MIWKGTWRWVAAGLLAMAGVGAAAPVEWPVAAGGNGHWYEAVLRPNGVTWFDADAAASAVNGYLATTTSAEENAFVFALVMDPAFWYVDGVGNTQGPWLGGYQDANAQQPAAGWHWVTGEPWGFTNWAAGEPNDLDYVENHAEDHLQFFGPGINNIASTWNDVVWSAAVQGYVVEWIPEPATLGLLALGGLVLLRRRRCGR